MEWLTFLPVLVLLCGAVCKAIDLNDDLKQLSDMLPGYYSYRSRHTRHVPHRFERPLGAHETPAEALTTIPLSATYTPVEVTFLPDCFNVYVEQTLHGKTRPHRRWLYSFAKDAATRSIKLRVYNFKDTLIAEKISKNPRTLRYLGENDVTTRSNCDMLWRRLGDTFVGTTSRKCVADVDGKQVRIYVTTTLTSTSLQIDEGWYNAHDGSKVIELDGPVFMIKSTQREDKTPEADVTPTEAKDKKTTKPLLQKDGRSMLRSSRLQNTLPERANARTVNSRANTRRDYYVSSNNVPSSNSVNNNSPNKKYHRKSDVYSNIVERAGFDPYGLQEKSSSRNGYGGAERTSKKKIDNTNKEKSMWNLQTYEGVIDALESGHKVYFTAKTKKCRHTNAKKREKTMIGDYVDMYEIQRDYSEKQPNKYLQFSFRRMQHSRKGFLDVIKQVTAHRNGSVHIVTVYLNEEGRIAKYFQAECALYNQDTRKGDVRFYLDPYRDVSEITRSKSLYSALQNGNMLRITTELDKCSGGHSDHVIIGGEFRGYDMGRNGKSADFSLKNTKLVQRYNGDLSVEEHFLIFQFPQRGEITLIRHRKHVTSLANNVSIVNGYQRYKCEMDANSSTKSISIFIT